MTGELEAAAADSFTEFFRRRKKHAFEGVGKPCANCGTALEGPYCHACGQNADTHKRSILHLIWEAIEGMFHLDGRLALTLPALFFRPGTLAKDYMEGRIVRHVPPFRTFLVALLLFIFAAEHAIHSAQHHAEEEAHKRAAALATPQGRAAEAARMRAEAAKDRDEALAEAAKDRDEDLKDPDNDKAKAASDYDRDVARAQARYARDLAKADHLAANPLAAQEVLEADARMRRLAADKVRGLSMDPAKLQAQGEQIAAEAADTDIAKTPSAEDDHGATSDAAHGAAPHGKEHWFKEGLTKALDNPEFYLVTMFGWGHRLAVLLLPMLGLSLTLVYLNKRRFFIYDHLIVATNLLSFAFLTNALGLVLPDPVRGWWFVLLMVWTPINLFQTLRGAYGSSIVGAGLKTLVVWMSTVISFFVLVTALLIFSLAQL
jgi:hypothetical protein